MMGSRQHIKYLLIVNILDGSILAFWGTGNTADESYKTEGLLILEKIQEISLSAGERQKVRTNNGAWYATCDDKEICYLTLTSSSYPEDYVYKLLQEVFNNFKTLDNYEKESGQMIQNHTSSYVPFLMDKYSDLENVKSIFSAESNLGNTDQNEGDSINTHALDNQDDLHDDRSITSPGAHINPQSPPDQDRIKQRRFIIYASIGAIALLILYLVY